MFRSMIADCCTGKMLSWQHNSECLREMGALLCKISQSPSDTPRNIGLGVSASVSLWKFGHGGLGSLGACITASIPPDLMSLNWCLFGMIEQETRINYINASSILILFYTTQVYLLHSSPNIPQTEFRVGNALTHVH